MADEHQSPGEDTGDSSTPEGDALDSPGSGDLGSGADGGPAASAASAGKALAKKGAETGVKKATGSDMAVSALRGAQKARHGDLMGGAQDVAASGAGALTTAAVVSTGIGAPVAGVAGSAVTGLAQTKAFRYVLMTVAALGIGALVLQMVVVASLSAIMLGAIIPPISQAEILSQTCTESSAPGASGPDAVVGSDIEEKAWNYLRGAGYTEEQTAGVMGNIERESGFNPFIAQGGAGVPNVSSGWGLVQWTADRHASVRDAVIDKLGERFYIAAPNIDQLPGSMTEDDVDAMVLFQLRYIITELQTNEQAAGAHLKSTTTVEEATRSFEEKYERAGIVAIDKRISYAEAFYEQYAGSPTPDSGGTESNEVVDSTDTQDPAPETEPLAPADVADTVASSTTAGCSGSSIAPGSGTGSVKPCPEGKEGCVNIAALIKPSASLSCPAGTTDEGTTTAYYKGQGKAIRLCALEGVTDANVRPIVMNATIAPAFVSFWAEAEKEGLDLTITSSFRSHAKQQALYASSPGGAARPGWSNHEFGMAFDIGGFSTSYSRNNCGSTQTPEGACSYPGTGTELERWKSIRALGLKHGMYIHDQEFWHIEFLPSGLHRDRNIDVYKG
ncbi:phage tail tip lysozyme [Brachybacterium sacelli]|uniref:Peptidase M15B domain-containing protein n=1 Tax=Brachybacterium sacelli TaxID=173364 RepID=A0ABS4X5K3_9MICO|nr:phage tail tip lysozyme [Brachybacterium sacelli]MBP2383745.1 hypothetical protein [Brachybacterium sacelli]